MQLETIHMVRSEQQVIMHDAILYENGNEWFIALSIAGQKRKAKHEIGGNGWYTIPAHKSVIIVNDEGGIFLIIKIVLIGSFRSNWTCCHSSSDK